MKENDTNWMQLKWECKQGSILINYILLSLLIKLILIEIKIWHLLFILMVKDILLWCLIKFNRHIRERWLIKLNGNWWILHPFAVTVQSETRNLPKNRAAVSQIQADMIRCKKERVVDIMIMCTSYDHVFRSLEKQRLLRDS